MQTIREDSKVLAPLPQQLASKCPNACSVMSLCYPPWIIACKAPLSMGFSKQEYWSGLPFPPLGIFPIQGLNPCLLPWQVYSCLENPMDRGALQAIIHGG